MTPKNLAIRSRRRALALLLLSSSVAATLSAQTAPSASSTPTTDTTKTPPVETNATGKDASADEAIQLSPFTVNTTKDQGYFADNTLAGSRLRTPVSDLGASITVVTKQQMKDTASLNMNDVFLYEANTEGTGNYTSFAVDTRGAAQDNNAGQQAGAGGTALSGNTSNRVRGIAPADRLRDYYPSNQRIPFDAYNTDSVEINRGPNSLLFGLGSPAGIVNQSVSKADVRKASTELGTQFGQYGAFRATMNTNVPIVQDKLAVYFAALHDEVGYERKPSYNITNRYYGAITWKPFERTTVRANFEYYDNKNRVPNFLTPRDFISPWIAAGKPSYDPVTRQLTVNGVVQAQIYDGNNSTLTMTGPSAESLQIASGNVLAFDGNNRPVMRISDGTAIDFVMRQLSSTPNVAGVPAAFTFNSPIRATKSQSPYSRVNVLDGAAAGITYLQPGVTNKAIYDYDSINILSGNTGHDTAKTYNVELEQEIIRGLNLQVGWYLEDYTSDIQYYISQQTGVTLYVDTNTTNLDGTKNANFGRPFIETVQPDRFAQPERNMTGRASLAYEYDFSEHQSPFVKWIGKQRFMGLVQDNVVDTQSLRFRPYISNYTIFNPQQADAWNPNTFFNAIDRRFYVGGTNSSVSTDPGLYPNGPHTYSLRWFDPITNAWENAPVQEREGLHNASSIADQKIFSEAISWQSYMFNERLVPTIGFRRDESKAATSINPLPASIPARLPDGFTNPAIVYTLGPIQDVIGRTKSYGGVLKPFKNWQFIDKPADSGSFWFDALRNVEVTYNKADNFNPAGIGKDFFGKLLDLPTGKTKDVGVGVSLFGGKLVGRITFYDASADKSRGGLAGQILTRTATVDDTFFRAYAAAATGTAINSQQVSDILKLPLTYGTNPTQLFNSPLASTSTIHSKGEELQVTYNPLPNWTMKVTGGEQRTINTNIGPELDAWLATRMPIWLNYQGGSLPKFWDITGAQLTAAGFPNTGLGDSQRVQDYFFTNIQAPAAIPKRLEGKVAPDQRRYQATYLTDYMFTKGELRGLSVGGAVRWADKAAIGYYASAPDPDGIVRSLDVNKPIYDQAQTHVDVWVAYTFKSLPWIGDKVSTKVQLNVRDLTENGGLQAVAANPDGTPSVFRIVDSRQFYGSVTFDF